VSAVPRHSEEELRQQWAFLDALVERQASSLKSGVQDPEEDDLPIVAAGADPAQADELAALAQRVTTLEVERATLLHRIDLAEEARVAAETARVAAEAARDAAERALTAVRAAAAVHPQPPRVEPSPVAAPPRQRSWWQRFRG
jgi:hypothetical protein